MWLVVVRGYIDLNHTCCDLLKWLIVDVSSYIVFWLFAGFVAGLGKENGGGGIFQVLDKKSVIASPKGEANNRIRRKKKAMSLCMYVCPAP